MRFICLLIFSISFSFVALAQDKLQPLPEVQNLSPFDFVEQSRVVTANFNENSALDFEMQIPTSYKVRPQNALKNITRNNTLYGELFYAYGPAIDDMRSYIRVESHELDRGISAKNWFVTEALSKGFTIRGIEGRDGGRQYDVFYVRLDPEGRTEIVRSRGFLHENRIVTVNVVIPVALWQSDRDKQILTAQSFNFINDYIVESPEVINSFNGAESFYMEYPNSWIFQQKDVKSVNRLAFNLQTSDQNNFKFADIDISVISSRSLKDRADQMIYPIDLPNAIQNQMELITNVGYEADKVLERHKYDLSYKTIFQTTEVYPLRETDESPYVTENVNPITKEFWLTVIRRPRQDGKNYIVSMVAPTRKTNLYQWAVATKAYEDIIKSIR